MRLAEPVPEIVIITTVYEGIGIVLSKPIFDAEVDFFKICKLLVLCSWRKRWLQSRFGGVMAAKAAQERGGLRQAAQPAGAGAPGRMRRAFLRRSAAFLLVSHTCAFARKVRTFGYCCTKWYACTVGPCGV